MKGRTLKRGTAVIWTQRGENHGSTKMVMGIVQGPVDANQVTIEIIEPDSKDTVLVTVPVEQVRHLDISNRVEH